MTETHDPTLTWRDIFRLGTLVLFVGVVYATIWVSIMIWTGTAAM